VQPGDEIGGPKVIPLERRIPPSLPVLQRRLSNDVSVSSPKVFNSPASPSPGNWYF
jgi:hypothetical protein